MSSKLFPGRPQIESCSAEGYFVQECLEFCPPRLRVTLLPYSAVIVLNFVLCLPLDTSLYIPQHYIIKHETYGQPGEKSLFTEESKLPP